jgi:hypothetical protein
MGKHKDSLANSSVIKQHITLLIFSLLLLIICSKCAAQDIQRQGFYSSIQPGFVWIQEKELSDPAPSFPLPSDPTYKRIALALDTQLGWAVTSNLILHGTLLLTIGESMDIASMSTTVDLAGGGATFYIPNNFFVTGNIGTSFANDRDCCAYTQFENGFSYQVKAGKEWISNKKWGIGVAAEYGGYSTQYGYVDVTYKNTVKRFGFRILFTHY